MNILVVEDNSDLGGMIKMFCDSNGFNTHWSQTGKEALEYCENNNVEMILFDEVLPDMLGSIMISEIKLMHPGCKSIFLDGWDTKEDVTCQYDGTISKPFLLSDLLNVIKGVV